MPKFSEASRIKLATCHPALQDLFNEVIKEFDCTIIEGHRGERAQNKAYAEGKSQLKFPNGNHNKYPSIAVDVAPHPIDFNDRERITHFAGYVRGVASQMGLRIRWGGDWDGDTETKDNKFDDLVHFELLGEEDSKPQTK